jgi:hypothetical protein
MTDTTGTYYYQPEKPQPLELLANPPYATGKDYEPACGTGAWLVQAAERIMGMTHKEVQHAQIRSDG